MVRPPLRLSTRRARCLGVLAAASLAAVPGLARANGRFPAAGQVVVSPSDARFLALRTTFGVVLSHDGGQSWSWACEQAIASLGIQEDPTLGLGAESLLAGTLEGLSASHDQGCSWAIGDDTSVIDLVVRPGSPASAVVLRSYYAGDGGALAYATTLVSTADDGLTWRPLGAAIDPQVTVQTVELARSDPSRVYVSGSRLSAGGATEGVVLVSLDGGAHYVTTVIPLDTGEGAPYLAGVDPSDAGRVYVRTNSREPPSDGRGDVPNRLLVLTVAADGSASARTVLTTTSDMLGFALGGDGKKVYVGGPRDGLQVASTTDFAFTKTSPLDVECLGVAGSTVYACSTEASGFLLGKTDDDGAHFAPLLHLGCLTTPLACAPDAGVSVCARPDRSTGVSPYDAFRVQNAGSAPEAGCAPGAGEVPDAAADAGLDAASGTVDASAEAGAASASPEGGGCSCRAAEGDGKGSVAGALLTTALVATALRRRRERPLR